jgi:carbon storage regulator
MLVLTRKPGEEVLIGDNIRLTIVLIRGKNVRLGVTAPPDVLIRRSELCPAAENAEPVTLPPATVETEP